MRLIRHIMLMTAVFLLAVSCGRKEDKVIPRSKLAEIYAEMMLVDQWIMNNPGNRHIADTSLVYEPVLERKIYKFCKHYGIAKDREEELKQIKLINYLQNFKDLMKIKIQL